MLSEGQIAKFSGAGEDGVCKAKNSEEEATLRGGRRRTWLEGFPESALCGPGAQMRLTRKQAF